jgi:hypothetical protein
MFGACFAGQNKNNPQRGFDWTPSDISLLCKFKIKSTLCHHWEIELDPTTHRFGVGGTAAEQTEQKISKHLNTFYQQYKM